jgi:hypothetical protein
MTVLLVLFTFVTFLLIDYFRTRNAIARPALEVSAAKHETAPRLQPALVAGFEVPENLRYHPGHTWARYRVRHQPGSGRRSQARSARSLR